MSQSLPRASWSNLLASSPGLAALLASATAVNPLQNAAQAAGTGGNGIAACGPLVFNGATFDLQRGVTGLAADGVSGAGLAAGGGYLFNGATWDRQRGNTAVITALSLAARTTQTDSATQTNFDSRGVLATLNITAASGTGGLQVRLIGDTNRIFCNPAPTAITATGQYAYLWYPGAGLGAVAGAAQINQVNSVPITRPFMFRVQVGDASSYTYELVYYLLV